MAVDFLRHRPARDLRRPGAEAHARAFLFHIALFVEQADHRLGGIFFELGAVRALDAADVARELDRRHLHAEAETEERHLVLARELRRLDFSFHAALAEAARNQDAGHIFELAIDAILQRLRVD